MKTVTIPENEYLQMRQNIVDLEKKMDLLVDDDFIKKLNLACQLFQMKKFLLGDGRISLKRGSAKGIITYIADDFDEHLEDFNNYME